MNNLISFFKKNTKLLFVLFACVLIIPTILYYSENRSILGFIGFLGCGAENYFHIIINFLSLTLLGILYFYLAKNNHKFFKKDKDIFIFSFIVSAIFIFVLPIVSQDVYYYFGVARLFEHFHVNPYSITINDFIISNPAALEDQILAQSFINVWANYNCPYPPLWTLITSLFTFLSFGSLDICLLICKLTCVVIHMVCGMLIHKIFNDRKFTILYALNPAILFHNVVDIHNDLFVLFFLLLALYFLLNKKNIFMSILFLGLSAAIKYIAILVLPFFIIYHFRELSSGKRFLQCIKYGLLFLVIMLSTIVLFIKPENLLQIFSTQQSYFIHNFYSIIENFINTDVAYIFNQVLFVIFVLGYIILCFYFLFKEEISIDYFFNTCFMVLIVFVFVVITNFRTWYLLWCLPFCKNKKELFAFVTLFSFILTMITNDNTILFPIVFYLSWYMIYLIKHIRKDINK